MRYLIDVVVDDIMNETEAEGLAVSISDALAAESDIRITLYPKFDKSYKLEFVVKSSESTSYIEEVIRITDRICSPWLVYYYDDERKVELIFNRDTNSRNEADEFNKIRWAYLQMGE